MFRLTLFELYKMSRRPRSYIGFAALLLVNFFVVLGIKYAGIAGFLANQASEQVAGIAGSPADAILIAWLVIGSPFAMVSVLPSLLPFFVSLIYGDIFAGESSEGTMRMMLARPISRASLFAAKVTACAVYNVLLLAVLGVSAYLMGWVALGRGGLMTFGTLDNPMFTWYPESEGAVRILSAYGLTALFTIAFGMLALFISTWLSNPLGAIGGAMMALFVMAVVGAIPYCAPAKPYLLSTHLFIGQNAFLDPVPWGELTASLRCIGAYFAVLLVASAAIFIRNDVLS